jgi:hypothetical protein
MRSGEIVLYTPPFQVILDLFGYRLLVGLVGEGIVPVLGNLFVSPINPDVDVGSVGNARKNNVVGGNEVAHEIGL